MADRQGLTRPAPGRSGPKQAPISTKTANWPGIPGKVSRGMNKVGFKEAKAYAAQRLGDDNGYMGDMSQKIAAALANQRMQIMPKTPPAAATPMMPIAAPPRLPLNMTPVPRPMSPMIPVASIQNMPLPMMPGTPGRGQRAVAAPLPKRRRR